MRAVLFLFVLLGASAFAHSLDSAGIKYAYYESSGTGHEWQT